MFLGIDGGGTKTKFTLKKEGQYFSTQKNTIHLKQVDDKKFYETIKQGVSEVLDKAGCDVKDIKYTFAAIPGFGQYPETLETIDKTFKEVLKGDNFSVDNDCVNGWAGSLNGSEGINLVLGTGAISYGVDKNGKAMRASGWGPFLGDEASGYYIGLKLLNYWTRMSDGRVKKSKLYDLIKERFNIDDDFEIINIATDLKREEIADISKLLAVLLEESDEVALKILDDIGYEASLAIDCLIDQMDFNKPVKVSYSGGVFNLGQKLIDSIKKHIKNEIEIVKPYTTPDKGAIIMAEKLYEQKNK